MGLMERVDLVKKRILFLRTIKTPGVRQTHCLPGQNLGGYPHLPKAPVAGTGGGAAEEAACRTRPALRHPPLLQRKGVLDGCDLVFQA